MAIKTIPGFNLAIEDNTTSTVTLPAVKNVYVLYGLMPDTLTYEDEEGATYQKYIEPNKPMLVASVSDAITTLETSDVALTREMRNTLKLLPSGVNIALVKVVRRDGENPDPENLHEMYEAFDFAFEMTENYPIKAIIPLGISMNDKFANEAKVTILTPADFVLPATKLSHKYAEGISTVSEPSTKELKMILKRDDEGATFATGVYNVLTFEVDGEQAQTINGANAVYRVPVDYAVPATPVYQAPLATDGVTVTIADDGAAETVLTASGVIKIALDAESYIEVDLTTAFTVALTANGIDAGDEAVIEAPVKVNRVIAGADPVVRALEHNFVITSTVNNCMTFIGFEPPKNVSPKALDEYVTTVSELASAQRTNLVQLKDGKKVDLGMFLSVVAGAHQMAGVGGITGFPQSGITTYEVDEATGNTVVVASKLTTSFKVGDIVEVYAYKKLDIVSVKATVVATGVSAVSTTAITLDKVVPDEIQAIATPQYIMNINNKDNKGTYLAAMWAGIIEQVGVTRSPAKLTFDGTSQIAFSSKQLTKLKAAKVCAVEQRKGTTQGYAQDSFLLTGSTSKFQRIENLMTIYDIVDNAKEVASKYEGKRISEGADTGLIKKEIEDLAFAPRVDVSIEAGYDLTLKFITITTEDGTKKKALLIDFGVTEIETLMYIRMVARLY